MFILEYYFALKPFAVVREAFISAYSDNEILSKKIILISPSRLYPIIFCVAFQMAHPVQTSVFLSQLS
jgi:hypothetical protein